VSLVQLKGAWAVFLDVFDCSPVLPYARQGELGELFVLLDTQSAVGAFVTTGCLSEGWLEGTLPELVHLQTILQDV